MTESVWLELKDVELSRGGRRLVSDLSFGVRRGQLALLTGPNGSGKTTLLRAIAGIAPPSGGSIELAGRRMATLLPEERREVAYQAHLEGLKKDLTVLENINFISELRNKYSNSDEILAELGLTPFKHRLVRQLSAGQKRRVGLAGLRTSGAGLWLLDEPLTNLDPEGRELIVRWLDEHLATGGAAVVATHLSTELKRPGSLLVEL